MTLVDATADPCTLRLYIDGRKAAEVQCAAGALALATDAPVDIGKSKVTAGVSIGQPRVIESEQM